MLAKHPVLSIGCYRRYQTDSLMWAGADGTEMISDIADAQFPGERAREWALKFEKYIASNR